MLTAFDVWRELPALCVGTAGFFVEYFTLYYVDWFPGLDGLFPAEFEIGALPGLIDDVWISLVGC